MVIARLIKEKLSSTPAGVVLTTRDFGVEMRYQPALAKALNRLVLQGELQKIAKGKYYIPKKTIFGNLKPADSELVKDFLEQNGKIVGYITGTAAFASMGLTTQISSSILVGTNKYRRPITRNGVKISFLLQENAITSSNIPLLRILDALRLIKDSLRQGRLAGVDVREDAERKRPCCVCHRASLSRTSSIASLPVTCSIVIS